MSYYTVPMITAPQIIAIRLGGIGYTLSIKYRNCDQGGWTIDIADASGNAILSGIPMVTGINLLAQYKYLQFGGGLYVQTTSDPDAVPTFDNLGTDALLYWVTNP